MGCHYGHFEPQMCEMHHVMWTHCWSTRLFLSAYSRQVLIPCLSCGQLAAQILPLSSCQEIGQETKHIYYQAVASCGSNMFKHVQTWIIIRDTFRWPEATLLHVEYLTCIHGCIALDPGQITGEDTVSAPKSWDFAEKRLEPCLETGGAWKISRKPRVMPNGWMVYEKSVENPWGNKNYTNGWKMGWR